MHIIFLPFFLATLAMKNAISWFKIAWEAVGFQLALIVLIALNVFLGFSLYETYRINQQTNHQLAATETALANQRTFWKKIVKEIPGHRQALEIQKTLAE